MRTGYQVTYYGLFLCSIQFLYVFGFDLDGYVNVALDKPTRQIHTNFEGPANLANDGNTAGNYSLKSCSHTNRTGDVWWMVDLLNTYHVQYIRIYNRVDQNSWFLADFSVHVSLNNPLNEKDIPNIRPETLCFNHTDEAPSLKPTNITCSVPIKGRYVYIWKVEDFLTLCEVEVLVKASDTLFKEMLLQISDGWRNDETPFVTVASNSGSNECIYSCLSFQQATTTIAQVHKATGKCECIQYSYLTSANSTNVSDVDWTMYTLLSN